MMSPPGGGSFMPMRPLGRAISDPSTVREELNDAFSNSPGYLPSGTSLVSWQVKPLLRGVHKTDLTT